MKVAGRGKRKILFVGEMPGKNEDLEGSQFVGDAGKLLRKILKSIDVDLDDCWKTNAVICHEESNTTDDKSIDYCRPNLTNTIAELKPEVIILLGASAVKSLIGLEWGSDIGPISKWVGWTIPSPTFGCWLCPTYHPSFVLRSNEDPALVKIVTEHLREAVGLAGTKPDILTVDQLRGKVEAITDSPIAALRIGSLGYKEGVLAFDYETRSLKPETEGGEIVSCSFCLNGTDIFAFDVIPELLPLISRVLLRSKLKKVGSNIKFETRWTLAKLGHSVAGWLHDTMLASHWLDNRGGISSIKFQAYVHLGIPDYGDLVAPYLKGDKNGLNRIMELHPVERLTYCGMDSLLEYMIYERQAKIVEDK